MIPQNATKIQEEWFREAPAKTIAARYVQPLGPPPFYLETELRYSSAWGRVFGLIAGIGLLLFYIAFLFPNERAALTLGRFMLIPLFCADHKSTGHSIDPYTRYYILGLLPPCGTK